MVQTDNGQDYLGVVLFHLGKPENESIGIEHFLLECLSFGGEAHTGEALARTVYDMLCKFKIQDRVWGVVCNNASNNAKMVDHLAQYRLKRLTGPESRIYCLLHVLNLTAQAIMCEFCKARPTVANASEEDEDEYADMPGLDKLESSDGDDNDDNDAPSWMLGGDEEDLFVIVELPKVKPGSPKAQEITQVGQVLYKLAKFAHKLQYSPKVCEVFKWACAEKEVETPHSVHCDLKTCWNSSGDMARDGDRTFSAMELRFQEPSLGIPRAHRLQKEDQKHLKNLNVLLELLKVLTEILLWTGVPMLVDVIVHFDELDSVHTSMAANTKLPLYVQQATERARIVLNKYYKLTDLLWLYRIAIILHPSMRAYYLKQADWSADWIEHVFKIAKEVYDCFYKPTGNSSTQATAPGPSQFGYSSYVSHMYSSVGGPSPSESVSPICKFANGSPLVDLTKDGEPHLRNPLLWWHNQCITSNGWNGLTQMALDVLSTPATSVDVERAFSFVGSFVSKHCHNLGTFTIQAAASLSSYSKAGLVKRGCLTLPQKAKAKVKAQPEGRSTD
ncbi:hypothetical protein FRC08_005227 [Ceratobasidium sp. 394]|nr:hypothetical protein FRC08_005227 [Ceratobasidium sp. 394]